MENESAKIMVLAIHNDLQEMLRQVTGKEMNMVNFFALKQRLQDGEQIVNFSFVKICQNTVKTEGLVAFEHKLNKIGIGLHLMQGGTRVKIAQQLTDFVLKMHQKFDFDILVLISNNYNFAQLIEEMHRRDVVVELFAADGNPHQKFLEVLDLPRVDQEDKDNDKDYIWNVKDMISSICYC